MCYENMDLPIQRNVFCVLICDNSGEYEFDSNEMYFLRLRFSDNSIFFGFSVKHSWLFSFLFVYMYM